MINTAFVPDITAYPGKFFVFEGIDGSGKTTCITGIEQYLKNKGHDVVTTLEPNKEFGLRDLIKDKLIARGSKSSVRTDLLAFSLDRSLHLDKGVMPWLEQGKIVLSDRYYMSTIAYQGYLQHRYSADRDFSDAVMTMQKMFFPDPNYIFFLDVDPKIGLERTSKRALLDKFEKLDLQEKLAYAYRDMAGKYGSKSFREIKLIDANKSPEEVQREVIKILQDKFSL